MKLRDGQKVRIKAIYRNHSTPSINGRPTSVKGGDVTHTATARYCSNGWIRFEDYAGMSLAVHINPAGDIITSSPIKSASIEIF